jgi:hypothetical protein
MAGLNRNSIEVKQVQVQVSRVTGNFGTGTNFAVGVNQDFATQNRSFEAISLL